MCDLHEMAESLKARPRFRNPVARDQAWARFYRRRGAMPLATFDPPSATDRLVAFLGRWHRLPLEMRQ